MAENGNLKVGKTITEVLCKSHYVNDHLEMGKKPITVAEDSGQYVFSIMIITFALDLVFFDTVFCCYCPLKKGRKENKASFAKTSLCKMSKETEKNCAQKCQDFWKKVTDRNKEKEMKVFVCT